MTRAASAALMPLRDARVLLLDGLVPVAPRSLSLGAARGRIAAAAVAATQNLPAGLTALRDGYAVATALVGGAAPHAPVLLARPPPWIEAGEPLPPGTDAVLPPEGLDGRFVVADLGPGEGTHGPGADLAAGAALLTAGERIGPGHILALAAIGHSAVAVRQPVLRLVATGTPQPDALSPALAALIAARGGTAEIVAAPDDADAIAAAILGGGADAVCVIGGTGFGRTDRSAGALDRAGRVQAHGIALRPGESTGFGAAGGRPVLLLPGRCEGALAAFLALGAPLLAALSDQPESPLRSAPLRRKMVSVIGVSEIVFVRCHADGVEPLGSADLPLGRLARADGAVLVEPEREGYPEGTEVEVVDL